MESLSFQKYELGEELFPLQDVTKSKYFLHFMLDPYLRSNLGENEMRATMAHQKILHD
jgi:hypothetical protein